MILLRLELEEFLLHTELPQGAAWTELLLGFVVLGFVVLVGCLDLDLGFVLLAQTLLGTVLVVLLLLDRRERPVRAANDRRRPARLHGDEKQRS